MWKEQNKLTADRSVRKEIPNKTTVCLVAQVGTATIHRRISARQKNNGATG